MSKGGANAKSFWIKVGSASKLGARFGAPDGGRRRSFMHIFAGFGIGLIVVLILAMIFGGFFMWIGAKIARVKKSTFGRAIVAAVGSSVVSTAVAFFFAQFAILGIGAGFFIGLLCSVLIIMGAFDTSFGKALLVWIFNVIAQLLAIALTVMITAGSFIFLRGI